MVSEMAKQTITINRVVLILVLLEDGIGEPNVLYKSCWCRGLNPCFTGRWYRRQLNKTKKVIKKMS